MLKVLILAGKDWQTMLQHVIRCAPLEACGLLAGKGKRVEIVLPMQNAAQSAVRFRLDPQEQWRAFQHIEAHGWELVGIYHSHPQGPTHLSPRDIIEAMYPVVNILWWWQEDNWHAGGFWIENREVSEVALQVDG